jgi:hypothetical protein
MRSVLPSPSTPTQVDEYVLPAVGATEGTVQQPVIDWYEPPVSA